MKFNKQAFIIALNDLKLTVRNKVPFALVIFMPLMMIALMGYAMKPSLNIENSGIPRFNVLYSNQNHEPYGQSLDQFLRNEGNPFFELVEGNPHTLDSDSPPKNFDTGINVNRTGEIELFSTGKNPLQDQVLDTIVESYVHSANTTLGLMKGYQEYVPTVNPERITGALSDAQTKAADALITVNVTENKPSPTNPSQTLSGFEFFAASMLIFFLLTTGMGVGRNLIMERQDKTFMRISSLPVTTTDYIAGKILGNALIGILQGIIIITASHFIFNVSWGGNLFGLSLIVLTLILISSALGVIFSNLLNSVKTMTTAMIVILWMMTFISGGFTGFAMFEPLPQFTVNKWAFDGIVALMNGGDLVSIIENLLVLGTVGLILLITGIAMYQRRVSHE